MELHERRYVTTILNPYNGEPYRIYEYNDGTYYENNIGLFYLCDSSDYEEILSKMEDVFF